MTIADIQEAADRVLADLLARPELDDEIDRRVMMLATFVRDLLGQKPTKSIETCGPMIEICVDAIWTSEAYRLAAALIRAVDADREGIRAGAWKP